MSEGNEYSHNTPLGGAQRRQPEGAALSGKPLDPVMLAVKQARLQGYLEGYLDQLSCSKDNQEELISRLLNELRELN